MRTTETLFIRVRRASENRRRTQVQLPISLFMSMFFWGVNGLKSKHTGDVHNICRAHVRRNGGIVLNTVKVEVPEIEKLVEPVLKLTRSVDGIVTYEAFDGYSNNGYAIRETLRDGLYNGKTTVTRGDRERATWFQFV